MNDEFIGFTLLNYIKTLDRESLSKIFCDDKSLRFKYTSVSKDFFNKNKKITEEIIKLFAEKDLHTISFDIIYNLIEDEEGSDYKLNLINDYMKNYLDECLCSDSLEDAIYILNCNKGYYYYYRNSNIRFIDRFIEKMRNEKFIKVLCKNHIIDINFAIYLPLNEKNCIYNLSKYFIMYMNSEKEFEDFISVYNSDFFVCKNEINEFLITRNGYWDLRIKAEIMKMELNKKGGE